MLLAHRQSVNVGVGGGGVGGGGGVVLRGGGGVGGEGGVVLRGGEEGRVRLHQQLEWRNKSGPLK